MLKEIKNKKEHYFEDESGRLQGEYKRWHKNGQLYIHCFFLDDSLHGEFKNWHDNGQLAAHCFFDKGDDITDQVKALVKDIKNITAEEKFIIKLNFGIPLC